MRVALVIGTRPQIIKSAPIIKEAMKRDLELDVVHTGQHYDYEMSRVFFKELELTDPAAGLCGQWLSTGRPLILLKWSVFLVTSASAPQVRVIPAISESKGSIPLPSRSRVPEISAALHTAP